MSDSRFVASLFVSQLPFGVIAVALYCKCSGGILGVYLCCTSGTKLLFGFGTALQSCRPLCFLGDCSYIPFKNCIGVVPVCCLKYRQKKERSLK